MSLLYTGLTICCIAGVLKESMICFAATFAFATLAIVSEYNEACVLTKKRGIMKLAEAKGNRTISRET